MYSTVQYDGLYTFLTVFKDLQSIPASLNRYFFVYPCTLCQWFIMINRIYRIYRIKTEEKGKVVAAVGGTELMQFFAELAIFYKVALK